MRDDDEVNAALKAETARLYALLEAAPAGILLLDGTGQRLVQNRLFGEIYEIPEHVVAGDVLTQMVHVAGLMPDREAFLTQGRALVPDEVTVSDAIHELTNGRVVRRQSLPVHGPDGEHHGRMYVVTDITQAHRAEQRLKHAATHDRLTGLANSVVLHDEAEAALERARDTGAGVAVLMLDLDRFKLVNDGYGHTFGNSVLVAFGERLEQRAPSGTTVGRMSGNEFYVLLPSVVDEGVAADEARRLIAATQEPLDVDGIQVRLNASVGICLSSVDDGGVDVLLDKADVAMYQAKRAGGGRAQVFSEGMGAAALERFALESALADAVPLSQISVVFQPKLHLETGRIKGAEALLRWNHPILGAISPAVFIPIAEETGHIVELGDWVLRTACAQAAVWDEFSTTPVSVAVNLSARQFLDDDIVARVREVLRSTGVPPHLLEIELTETTIARDIDDAAKVLSELRELGVDVSIDDFGTGYSSFQHLRTFEVGALKIDRAFVTSLPGDEADESIVRAIVEMAHVLGFRVVAEGVETEGQLETLRSFGCDEIQGYLLSRPLTPEAFTELLGAHQPADWSVVRG